MSRHATTRRQFMRSAATVATATAVGWKYATESLAQPGGGAGRSTIRVRRDVMSLDPDGPEVAALKAGVQAMKKRGENDPAGWIQQNQIHNRQCPHGNFFFLPWHRAYLYHFEQICREASGFSDFALPYWNWTAQRSLPPVFWGTPDNPLFHANRAVGPNQPAPSSAVGQEIINRIMRTEDFEIFASSRPLPLEQRRLARYGTLEGGPHNAMHGFVGGDMGRVPTAALDPCFWLHHANVDRLWAEWAQRHPAGTIADADWRSFDFANNFFHPDGSPVASATVESTLNTYAMGYRYDTQPPIASEAVTLARPRAFAPELSVTTTGRAAASWGSPSSVAVTPTQTLSRSLEMVASRSIADVIRQRRLAPAVQLLIEGVKPPSDPNMMVRVYLNCSYLSQETGWQDPHFVGSFAFFGQDHQHDGQHDVEGATYQFDIAETIQELQSASDYDAGQPLNVQMLPEAIAGEGPLKGEIAADSYRVTFIERMSE